MLIYYTLLVGNVTKNEVFVFKQFPDKPRITNSFAQATVRLLVITSGYCWVKGQSICLIIQSVIGPLVILDTQPNLKVSSTLDIACNT